MGLRRPDVEVRIDRLVLTGFEHVSPAAIDAALRAELARRFAAEGAVDPLAESHRVHRLDGGSFELPAGAGSAALGARIGRCLYSQIRPGAATTRPPAEGGKP